MRSLFLIVFALTGFSVTATHVVGSEITYSGLGNNQYYFRVKYWVDCAPSAPITSVMMRVCSFTCSFNNSYALPVLNPGGTPVFPYCSWPNSVCVSGPDAGIREYTFGGTVSLSNCPDYTFFTELCCRNGAITNITNPLTTGMNVRAMLNAQVAPDNSAPAITSLPVTYACCNLAHTYPQISNEPDGDSIVYSLYHPWTDGMTCMIPSNTITYAPPFTYQQFITTQTPITLNAGNGDLFLHPTVCGESSVFGIQINEYRGGNLVGIMTRDVSILVTPLILGEEIPQYPNQLIWLDDESNILVGLEVLKDKIIEIYDTAGRLALVKTIGNEAEIDLGFMNPGMYFFRSGDIQFKFLIK
ncbi:MAG: T9SS type A sorting domain-containing protein [Bacteroidia bacterium]|nr:T9SS type A sorting domain-containing protein [Bacteroidia bacterium]